MLSGNISLLYKNPVKQDKIGYDDVLPAFHLVINKQSSHLKSTMPQQLGG
jgi:hypothetical protein